MIKFPSPGGKVFRAVGPTLPPQALLLAPDAHAIPLLL